MKRIGGTLIVCALAALLAGCDPLPAPFEDVGNDPHPPTMTLVGIGIQRPAPTPPPTPEPAAAAEGDALPPVTYFPPTTVITLLPNDKNADTLALKISYADAGGDIDAVVLADADGPINGNIELPEFLGTAGTFESTVLIPTTAQEGLHHMTIWAQDANRSRSEKTEFTINVQLF